MIDLHTHTKYSDGTWTVRELLKKAKEKGVTVLSITDHGDIKAHKELQENGNYKEIYDGKIITGAEFDVMFNKVKIEILGYQFNVNQIDKMICNTYDLRDKTVDLNEEFRLLMEACRKNNIKIDDLKYETSIGWSVNYVFEELKKHEENRKLFSDKEWNDEEYFFRCCTCNVDFPVYVDFSYRIPEAKMIANAIRKAGGKVFIAHLFTYVLDDYIKYLDMLREENIIDGIEVYYSEFTSEQIKMLENYCKKYNLLVSCGTDCHGDSKSNRKIGSGYGTMNVGEEKIENWIN